MNLTVNERERAFEALSGGGAKFHGSDQSGLVNWALSQSGLRFILDSVSTGDRTLETGCGYSTVVFALAAAQHTCISPRPIEHGRILEWCSNHGIPTDSLRFIARASQDVLPELDDAHVDFVLIDGDHAFPIPFIDWYYCAQRLRVGGLLMVDDTQIRTGTILHDFLEAEGRAGRWRVVQRFHTSAVFEKLASDIHAGYGWRGQPYCEIPERGFPRTWLDKLRIRVRLRSRVREALIMVRKRRSDG